eukprot:CFRG5941T1
MSERTSLLHPEAPVSHAADINKTDSVNERKNRALTVMACVGWVIMSASNITLTNYILHRKAFKYPVTISLIQQLFGFIFATVLVHGKLVSTSSSVITPRAYAVHVLPIGFVTAVTLAAGGAVYVYLSVSFIQMLKGVSPVITMLLMFSFGMLKPRSDMILSIVIISVAGLMASFGEVEFSIFGFLLMMISQVCDVLKIVLTERLLINRFENIMDAIYHIAPATLCGLITIWSYQEAPKLWHTEDFSKEIPLWLLAVACSGFGVNILFMIVVHRANSLTFKVLGQIKSIVMILSGMAIFDNHVSGLQWASYAVSIMGFVLYQRSMMRSKKDACACITNNLPSPAELSVEDMAPIMASEGDKLLSTTQK